MAHLWPVIHLDTPELAYRNAAIAQRAGVRGVFLIHMDGLDEQIDPIAEQIKQRYPGLRVGVNYLSLDAPTALARAIALGHDASWSDKPGVRSDYIDPSAQGMSELLRNNPKHQFFASVAFKYQPNDPDPGTAAMRALRLGMTPTTSGKGTGHAPPVEKLALIRQTIGAEAPLALASGATPDNAQVLAPYLSDILVSTGISSSFSEFDEALLGRLVLSIQPAI
jgi:hypothetical protein